MLQLYFLKQHFAKNFVLAFSFVLFVELPDYKVLLLEQAFLQLQVLYQYQFEQFLLIY